MGCLGVEFVQFQGLLPEASSDLIYQFSLRELTLSGSYRFKPNRPLAVFLLTVRVDDVAKVTGIWRPRVPMPSVQEIGHISNRHVIPNQVLVVFKGNFHNQAESTNVGFCWWILKNNEEHVNRKR